MDNPEFRTALTVVKLLTSSVFARKRPYMITSKDRKGQFYYTNITVEGAELYHPDSEDVLSRVCLENNEIIDTFYKAFPKLNEMSVIFELATFSTAINKYLKVHKDDEKVWFPDLIVKEGDTRVYIDVPVSRFDKITKEQVIDPMATVGQVISDDTYKLYDKLIDEHKAFSTDVQSTEYILKDGEDYTKLKFERVGNLGPSGEGFMMPMLNGFTIGPSVEYLSKRHLPMLFNLDVLKDTSNLTAKVMMRYYDDWFNSLTILPGSLWFLSRLNGTI